MGKTNKKKRKQTYFEETVKREWDLGNHGNECTLRIVHPHAGGFSFCLRERFRFVICIQKYTITYPFTYALFFRPKITNKNTYVFFLLFSNKKNVLEKINVFFFYWGFCLSKFYYFIKELSIQLLLLVPFGFKNT